MHSASCTELHETTGHGGCAQQQNNVAYTATGALAFEEAWACDSRGFPTTVASCTLAPGSFLSRALLPLLELGVLALYDAISLSFCAFMRLSSCGQLG